MGKRLTNDDFIEKAQKVHGDKYDYSKVVYTKSNEKVIIVCPIHGEFQQKPNHHLSGRGCPSCAPNKKKTKEECIENFKKVHGNKYDYSKVNYTNSKEKVTIICHIHGEFQQKPNQHLNGCGCPKCGLNKKLKRFNSHFTKEVFIKKCLEIHGNKYDYSKVEYRGATNTVTIICPIHGEFKQVASYHLSGNGCQKCGEFLKLKHFNEKYTNEVFILKSFQVHGDKYDYSKVEYLNSKEKVNIICPEHGVFLQRPNDHLNGYGCPRCSESKLEKDVGNFLNNKKIKFERQKTFKWLGKQRLDFYLSDYNVAIECQGEQHFKPVDFVGRGMEWANNCFLQTQERDRLKKELCDNNNVKILYYSNLLNYNTFLGEKIYHNLEDVIKNIKYMGED